MGRDTGNCGMGGYKDICFNPRARMGRDIIDGETVLDRASFNPRARMGRDEILELFAVGKLVSIHAPAWGATPYLAYIHYVLRCFNPRARMGRDYYRD